MREVPKWVVGAPFLVSAYLALVLVGRGANIASRRSDLWGSLALFLLTALLCWWCSRLVGGDRGRRVISSVVLVIWLSMLGTARLLLAERVSNLGLSAFAFFVAWTIPFFLLLFMLRRSPPPDVRTVRTLAYASGLLVLFQSPALISAPEPPRPAPSIGAFAIDRTSARPDIYLILLDKFSSPTNMKRYYGEDLGWFVDSLKHLGFAVPERARTNYIHTGMVLAALLNGTSVHDDLQSGKDKPWDAMYEMIQQASLWKGLSQFGYRMAFFPSGFPGTWYAEWAEMDLRHVVGPRTRFGETWLINTPAELARQLPCLWRQCRTPSIFPMPVESRAALEWKLETLITLGDSAGPVAAFLHYLGAHEPYLYRRDCSARDPWWPKSTIGPDSTEIRQAYADQVHCVATQVLHSVTSILERPGPDPVILLQADHGNGGIGIFGLGGEEVGADAVTQRQLRERLEVFAAYYVPAPISLPVDSLSPVTLLPVLFNHMFSTAFPVEPLGSYWSTWNDPLRVTPMRWIGDSIVKAGAAH